MNHYDAWRMVVNDLLIGLCYGAGPLFFICAGATASAADDPWFAISSMIGIIFTVVANLISAGVIK